MAATLIRPATGTTAYTSGTISVPAGSIYNIFLYTDSGLPLPAEGGGAVYLVTPSGNLNVCLGELDARHRYSCAVVGPADVVVVVPASGQNLGVARYP
jgi:hypothetical protein